MSSDPMIIHGGLDGVGARVLGAGGAVTPVAELPAGGGGVRRPVVWLVHTEDLLLVERELAVRRRRDMAEALPYALEEDLVSEPGAYALAFTVSGGVTHAVAADRWRLRAGYGWLRGFGLRPRAVVPDVLALPEAAGAWVMLVADGRALVRTGALSGFACGVENVALLLGRTLADSETKPERLVVYGAATGLSEDDLAGVGLETEVRRDEDPLGLLARGTARTSALNLVSQAAAGADYRPAERNRLVAAGALVVVALAVFLGARWYEVQRLRADNARLEAAIEAVYRQTFPDQSRVVDARLQMEQQLRALRGGDGGTGFLPLLARAKDELGPAQGVPVLAFRYGGETLTLSLELTGLQALDRLKRSLESAGGLRVAVESVEKVGEGVRVDLRLSGEGT